MYPFIGLAQAKLVCSRHHSREESRTLLENLHCEKKQLNLQTHRFNCGDYILCSNLTGGQMIIRKVQWPPVMVSQIGIASLMAAAMAFFLGEILHNWQMACTLVLGIFLWMLPNAYFASKVFRRLGRAPSASLLSIFYRAEIIKLLLSGFFFVMMIKLVPVNFPALLTGYFIPQLIFWVRLIVKNKEGVV